MEKSMNMLDRPVTVLPGIGPKRAETVKKLGLETVRDVVFSFPRAYKDFQKVLTPHTAQANVEQLITGTLLNLNERNISGGRRIIQARLDDMLTLTWFIHYRGRGPSFLYRRLQKIKQIWVYGMVKDALFGLEMNSPEFFDKEPMHHGLMPVYPLISGVSNEQRKNWIRYALNYSHELEECLPPNISKNLLEREQAFREIHFPADWEMQAKARKRIVFEEFFLFNLGLQYGVKKASGFKHSLDGELVERYLKSLPFELTDDQQDALKIVGKDMESTFPMRRLIHGEVGSGKTIVAEYGAIKAVESGGQVAMMVPTEVLARQMIQRLKGSLGPLGINVTLLIGHMPAKESDEVRKALANGSAQVAVGTHALITEKVKFKNLTLAIVDEQHRFGVRQRLALLDKGNADLLVMSATPIPRSLALTLYGDLETTEIRQLPQGRKEVDTRLVDPRRRNDVYDYLVSRIKRGEQAYVVFPLVEESDKLDLKAAVNEMEELKRGLLSTVSVGLLHGQMGKEKEEIFQAFYNQEIQVLLATTVIEVGMNVPNATVMVIENAERYGLAQLHQLRGRVGRGDKPGICFLLSYNLSELGRARLDVIRNTNDGFKIAEEDLKLRGPGDLLGVRQSGQPLFKLANLLEDSAILEESARLVQELLLDDPDLKNYSYLKNELKRQRY